MSRLRSWSMVALAACTGVSPSDPSSTSTTGGGPTLTDTGWPPGDVGAFQVAHDANDGTVEVFAVGASSPPNYPNLAQCGAKGSVCFGAFPTDEDTFVRFDPDRTLDRAAVQTRYLGYEVTVGPYSLPYQEDQETDYGYYAADGTALPYGPGWLSVGWGGQWPDYGGGQDLYVPEPIQLLSPHPGGSFTVTNGATQTIEWIPSTDGFVTLAVIPKFADGTLYLLEDDGFFDLPADDLALGGEIEDLTLVLTRWNIEETEHFGHVVRFVSSSDARFDGQLLNVGAATEIDPADQCAQAQGSLSLGPGDYWGSHAGEHDDLSPNTTACTGQFGGDESVVKLEVGPHHQVAVSYNLPDRDGSVYLLTDCADESSCLTASDESGDPNVPEFLAWFNPDDDPRTVYLVLDSADNTGEPVYSLDVTDTYLAPPPAVDTCAEAESAPTVTPAVYYADFVAYTGTSNPGAQGCTDSSLPGPEALIPIEIPSGATLNANVTMDGGDVALYLLFDCDVTATCADGSDGSLDQTEAITYQNGTAFPQRAYLVVDSKAGLRPFVLSVDY